MTMIADVRACYRVMTGQYRTFPAMPEFSPLALMCENRSADNVPLAGIATRVSV